MKKTNNTYEIEESVNEKGERILIVDGMIVTWVGVPDAKKVANFLIEEYFKNKSLCK